MAYHRPLDSYEEYIAHKHEREAETLADTQRLPATPLTPAEHERIQGRKESLTFLFWICVCGVVTLPLVPFLWGYYVWLDFKYPSVRGGVVEVGDPRPIAVSVIRPPATL